MEVPSGGRGRRLRLGRERRSWSLAPASGRVKRGDASFVSIFRLSCGPSSSSSKKNGQLTVHFGGRLRNPRKSARRSGKGPGMKVGFLTVLLIAYPTRIWLWPYR
jgi:hypothetical protein